MQTQLEFYKGRTVEEIFSDMQRESREARPRRRAYLEMSAQTQAQSKFKLGQLVTLCMPGVLHLNTITTVTTDGHDHSDPKSHQDSRVVGWTPGCVQVAMPCEDNRFSCQWPWLEGHVSPSDAADWAEASQLKPGRKVLITVEDIRQAPAYLSAPHINQNDWIVYYYTGWFNSDGITEFWNRCMVNEKDMVLLEGMVEL